MPSACGQVWFLPLEWKDKPLLASIFRFAGRLVGDSPFLRDGGSGESGSDVRIGAPKTSTVVSVCGRGVRPPSPTVVAFRLVGGGAEATSMQRTRMGGPLRRPNGHGAKLVLSSTAVYSRQDMLV